LSVVTGSEHARERRHSEGESDRQRVPQRERPERPPHDGRPPFLQAQRHREEPTHPRVEPVDRSEEEQNGPRARQDLGHE
jgi:hypothetical protein